MKFDKEDQLIKKSLNTIHTPTYDIKSHVQQKMSKKNRTTNFKRIIPVTVAAAMMFVFTIGVGAAYFPSFNHLVSIVSPEIADKLQPIEESSESDGIKMAVVAAMSDEEMAVIYVTMQDVVGNRIDETTDLYDSYDLTGANMYNSEMVNFDETTKTATFRIQANGGKQTAWKKHKFQVGAFLSNRKDIDEILIDRDLQLLKNKPTQTTVLDLEHSSGRGGEGAEEIFKGREEINILGLGETPRQVPEVDLLSITNIGFVDNKLHVQAEWDESNVSDHGEFYLIDKEGSEIHSTASVNFGVNTVGEVDYGNNRIEYIFDVDQNTIENSKLFGDFTTYGTYITGDWSTTFKLDPVEEKVLNITEKFDTVTVNKLSVSPLGITLSGEYTGEEEDLDIQLLMKDGSTTQLDAAVSFSDKGEYVMKHIANLPIDLSQVQSVIINDVEVNIK